MNSNSTSTARWLVPASAVKAGQSATFGNDPMFYATHVSACINGIASLLGCIAVLLHVAAVPVPRVVSVWSRGLFHPWGTDRAAAKRADFSARFAMYLAVADLIWHSSHLIDHAMLLATKQFPDDGLATGLAFNLFVWFGYCQLMHCVLSAYSYLKICRNVHLKFGKHDWKLHVVTFGTVVVLSIVFYLVNGFGSFAYWCLGNSQALGGSMVSFISSMVATTNALATTIGNREIQKKVKKVNLSTQSASSRPARKSMSKSKASSGRATASAQSSAVSPEASPSGSKRTILSPNDAVGSSTVGAGSSSGGGGSSSGHGDPSSNQRSYVAAQCLRTLVRTARLVYIPLAIGSVITALLSFVGIAEPIACFVVATSANCSGWVNAYAYFHNELLKASLRTGTTTAAPSQAGTIQSTTGAGERGTLLKPLGSVGALGSSTLRGQLPGAVGALGSSTLRGTSAAAAAQMHQSRSNKSGSIPEMNVVAPPSRQQTRINTSSESIPEMEITSPPQKQPRNKKSGSLPEFDLAPQRQPRNNKSISIPEMHVEPAT
ncbi:hypothetical protein H9P43_002894 [Blastocladiella emersonii ATCC 22665]|nr:hypothetical protein H9P43_002894 [Blastocladiella emersonii ATCC 22665]